MEIRNESFFVKEVTIGENEYSPFLLRSDKIIENPNRYTKSA